MSRVLVTGAAGFIGSHLCEALIARGDTVLGVDAFTEYYSPARKRANLTEALEAGLEFRPSISAATRSSPVVEGVDVVYHLAAQPGVRPSWGQDFALYAQRNLVGHAAAARSDPPRRYRRGSSSRRRRRCTATSTAGRRESPIRSPRCLPTG